MLSSQVQPIHSFLAEANQHGVNYPQDAFCANILSMPWFDLMDEFEGLELLSPYLELTLIGDLKPLLVNEAMTIQELIGIDDENH